MITQKYKAHPRYQSSGEEWLGEVPSTWKVLQLKHLSVVKRGASPRPIDDPKYFSEDGEYAWTRIADVSASETFLIKSTQRLSRLGSSLSVKLQPGELFLSIAGSVGKPCITKIKACIHDGFVYFPELKTPPKFLFYIFAGEQAYKGLGKFGTQLNLNTDTVGSIKVGLPPLPEQIQIARFLDHETGKIDLLIEKQQELIALLKEKRQAVISHAVTKGLSPQAPLKDSGIEWLGQVPEHWEVFKSSHVFCSSPRNGLSPSASEGSGSLPAFSISAVRKGKVKISNHVKYALGTPAATKRFRVRKGDVLVVRGNGNLTMVGQAGIVVGNIPKFCIYPDILIRLSLDDSKVSTQYFVHAWNSPSSRTQIELRANTTNGTYKVASEAIKNIKIPVPPTAEQALIVKFLEERTSQFDSLLRTAETQITLLQERRTALISAAVTGKINVRDWEPPEEQEASA